MDTNVHFPFTYQELPSLANFAWSEKLTMAQIVFAITLNEPTPTHCDVRSQTAM